MIAVSAGAEAADLCNAIREFLPELVVILVEREDVVAQFGSLCRARRTGQWQTDHASSGGAGMIEIDDEWTAKAAQIEEFEVPLEKSDITVDDPVLVWLPIDR